MGGSHCWQDLKWEDTHSLGAAALLKLVRLPSTAASESWLRTIVPTGLISSRRCGCVASYRAVNLQLKNYDALITASALIPAPAFADIDPNCPPNWPIQTMPFNVIGNPAMSIPTGFGVGPAAVDADRRPRLR